MAESSAPIPATRPTATVLWTPPPGGRRARAQPPGGLFGPDHPVVLETMTEAHELIDHLLAARLSLRFSIYEDAFFVENTVLLEESLQLQPLLVDMRARAVGAIELP